MCVSAANLRTLGELEISAAFSPCISVRSEGTAAAWEPLPLTQPVSAQSSELFPLTSPTQLSISRVSSPVLTSIGKFVYAKCGPTFYCYYSLNNTNIPCHCIKWNEESVICPLEAVWHMCKYNTIPHRERSSLHFGVLAQLSGMFPLSTEQRLGLLLGLQ